MGDKLDLKVIAFRVCFFAAKHSRLFSQGQSPSSPVGPDLWMVLKSRISHGNPERGFQKYMHEEESWCCTSRRKFEAELSSLYFRRTYSPYISWTRTPAVLTCTAMLHEENINKVSLGEDSYSHTFQFGRKKASK